MGKVHFASSTVHSPWTALRVRWVPVDCFPTLSLRAFALYVVFPRSDYYALFDCLLGLGVSFGFPHAYSPPSLPSLGRVGTVDPVGMACPPPRTVLTPFGVYGSPSL